jgi:hypothetical protein
LADGSDNELRDLIEKTTIENKDGTIDSINSIASALNDINTRLKNHIERLTKPSFVSFLKNMFED